MNREKTAPEKLARSALTMERLLCAFAGTIIILTFLELRCLSSKPPLNYVWLGTSAAVGGAAILATCLWFFRWVRAGLCPQKPWALPEARIFLYTTAWCLWCYVACFLAIHDGLAQLHYNARYLFYVGAQIMVIFPLGYYMGRQGRMRLLWTLYDLGAMLMFLYLLYACVRFAMGDRYFIAFADHTFNMTDPRIRFGVNPNGTGGYCAFFLILGLYRWHTLGARWKKALFCVPMGLFFFAFTVSESRSSFFAVAAAMAVFAGALIWRRNSKHDPRQLLAAGGAALAAAAAVMAVLYTLLPLIHTAHAGLLSYYDRKQLLESQSVTDADKDGSLHVSEDGELPEGELPTYEFASRKLIGDESATSSLGGRGAIWHAALDGTLHSGHMLLHGCSQGGVIDVILSRVGTRNHTHNQFLEMLVSYGVPGLLFFLGWLCWIARRSLTLGLGPTDLVGAEWMLPLTLLMQIINNMAEIQLVGEAEYTGFMFFLLAGYAGGLAARLKAKTPG